MSFVLASTVLAIIGPIARTNALRSHGVTKREITRAHEAGEIIRVRQGVYAASGTSVELIHAVQHGGAPACLTAGRLHGLWILDVEDPDAAAEAPTLHVWFGHAGERHGCDLPSCSDELRLHWDDGSVTPGELPPIQNVLLQIAVCAGEEPFFVALESALRKCLLPHGGVKWLRDRLPEKLRWLLDFARADADSGLESLIRLRLHHLGITVRTQVLIDGVGEVDFVIGDRLIIEADGKQNHEGSRPDADLPMRSLRHKDLLRDARAAALGYETLRFDYALIVHDWPTVAAAIVAKVAAGAHLRG